MTSHPDEDEALPLRSPHLLPIREYPRQEASDVTAGVDRSRLDYDESVDPSRVQAMYVDAQLYESARLIAELRGEKVTDVVARALRSYAQGRKRPRD